MKKKESIPIPVQDVIRVTPKSQRLLVMMLNMKRKKLPVLKTAIRREPVRDAVRS